MKKGLSVSACICDIISLSPCPQSKACSYTHTHNHTLTHSLILPPALPLFSPFGFFFPFSLFAASAVIFQSITLDLSRYVKEILEGLLPQLLGTEALRISALSTVASITPRCSDGGNLESGIALLIDTLNGKGVKLSSWEQRAAVLAALGLFTQAPLAAASRSTMANKVIDALIGFVTREAHEGTQAEAASQIAQYSVFLSTATGNSGLQATIKAVLEDTKTRHAVVLGFLRAAYALFRNSDDKCPLNDSLLKFLEKLPPVGSHTLVASEAAVATHILLRATIAEPSLLNRLQGSKWWATNFTEAAWFSDRFAQTVGEDVGRIFSDLAAGMVDGSLPYSLSQSQLAKWASTFAPFLLHPQYSIRKYSQERVRRVLSSPGHSHFAVAILGAMQSIFDSYIASVGSNQSSGNLVAASTSISAASSDSSVSQPSTAIMWGALRNLMTPSAEDAGDARKIATAIVLIAHHPVLQRNFSPLPALWESLHLDVAAEFRRASNNIGMLLIDSLSGDAKNVVVGKNTLKQLSAVKEAAPLIRWLVNWISEKISDHSIDGIGPYEVAVWKWKEGILYSEAAAQKEAEELVRNSKDYAERKWEQEVRKELAAKKGGAASSSSASASASGSAKVSKKQEEQQRAQLQKESGIRASVERVNSFLEVVSKVLDSILDGTPDSLGCHLSILTSKLLSRVRSALFAREAGRLFVRLAAASKVHPLSLARLVGSTILRTRYPVQQQQQPLSSEWLNESLDAMVARVMRAVWSISHASALEAPAFVYCLPLAEFVLRSATLPISVMEDALVFLNAHVELGASPLVPHLAMLTLLVHVISTHSRLSHQASILLGDYSHRLAALEKQHGQHQQQDQDQDQAQAQAQDNIDISDAYSLAGVVNVLLHAVHNPSVDSRAAAVRGLQVLSLPAQLDDWGLGTLWMARFDDDANNAKAAVQLWDSNNLQLEDGIVETLLETLLSTHEEIRGMAARALAALLEKMPQHISATVIKFIERYHALLVEPKPLRDELGNVLPIPPPDPWEGRCGISEALAVCAPLLPATDIANVVFMFVEVALGDRNDKAQATALKASIAIVDSHGKEQVNLLYPIIESRLVSLSKQDGRGDIVRQSAVVLLGTLAKHLDKADPKIPSIVNTLVATLWTPSQPVQEAVANCLVPLAPAIKDQAESWISSLMQSLFEGETYGVRRGAAYGIAGLVKGLGILALKQYGIMDTLLEAVQNKKSVRHREGALMTLELLCLFLGRLFEPYVIHVLPHLLTCYGDGNSDVRAAAEDTARAIMSKLSAHGVKLVLPALLTGLDDDSWRTKVGSVELLGAMANCAPKQLSGCLPQIVPRLASVLTDSHAKVQQAGRDAMNQITHVIKNPEVVNIVPTILAALSDPANKTQACLDALLQTAFVHVIDAASLATLMPVLQRALGDRASDTKMRAAQIIGNMYVLTDPKDFAPYVDALIPGLKTALTDPSPEVRAVAAKALGATFKGMGESNSGDLIPWLLETLRSNTSTVDRAGAAQGLSEVLFSIGVDRLSTLMDSFVAGTMHSSDCVREGHFLLFVYLPATFGELFSPFVARVVPCVLRGLADVEETVRDAATRTGQRIIAHFADQAVELLLPELEVGMQHEHWRIRECSVNLLGDLLYRISGASGNKTTEGEEDDNFGTEEVRDAILGSLGVDRRDRVFARLYLARSDIQLSVRQAALHVWKVVVTHTVRTLREIMPTLIKLVLGYLASGEHYLRSPAARTLGELVKKLGERVLPDILPILEAGLSDEDVARRQGVCIALVEIMDASSREVISLFSASLIPAVRKALCDPSPAVREAAANTFSALHSALGSQTIDDILPQLLAALNANDATSEATLDGLRLIMAAKSKVLLPFLVPRLIHRPISSVSAKALASLTAVAGSALAKYTNTILEALLNELQMENNPNSANIREAASTLVLSADEASFVDVMTELLNGCSNPDSNRRIAAIRLLSTLCQDTTVDYSQYRGSLLRGLLKLFSDPSTEVQSAAWAGVSAVLAKSPVDDKAGTLRILHQMIRNIASDRNWKPIPGFSLPRGLEPFIAVYVEGLSLNGTEIKELAAEGLGHLVRLTTEEELSTYSLKITGPLIRLSSEGVWQVRAATLAVLVLLLEKIPLKLKAFIPQLQPTCVKALKESSRIVRDRATEVLTHIIQMQKDRRIDPLLTELNTASKTAEPSVKVAIFQTLEAALHHGGATATEPVKDKVRETLMVDLSNTSEDDLRVASAKALAAWANLLSNESLLPFLQSNILSPAGASGWCGEHGRATFMNAFAWNYGPRIIQLGIGNFTAALSRWLKYEHSMVVGSGAGAASGILSWACNESNMDAVNAVGPLLAGLLSTSDMNHDALLTTLQVIVKLGKKTPVIMPRLYAILVPALLGIIRLKSGPVKAVSG